MNAQAGSGGKLPTSIKQLYHESNLAFKGQTPLNTNVNPGYNGSTASCDKVLR